MSSATDDGFGPFCGALGCTDDADVVKELEEQYDNGVPRDDIIEYVYSSH